MEEKTKTMTTKMMKNYLKLIYVSLNTFTVTKMFYSFVIV